MGGHDATPWRSSSSLPRMKAGGRWHRHPHSAHGLARLRFRAASVLGLAHVHLRSRARDVYDLQRVSGFEWGSLRLHRRTMPFEVWRRADLWSVNHRPPATEKRAFVVPSERHAECSDRRRRSCHAPGNASSEKRPIVRTRGPAAPYGRVPKRNDHGDRCAGRPGFARTGIRLASGALRARGCDVRIRRPFASARKNESRRVRHACKKPDRGDIVHNLVRVVHVVRLVRGVVVRRRCGSERDASGSSECAVAGCGCGTCRHPTRGRTIAITNDGMVWYSETGLQPNTIVRFDPKTERFASGPVPVGGGVIRNMAAAPDGRVFIACSGANQVGVVEALR